MIYSDIGEVPRGAFDIAIIDPPWKFSSNSAAKPGRNAMRHYSCMTDSDLAAMPIRNVLKSSALAFVWTTAPMMARAFPIIDAWGLKYVSQLIWCKNKIATGYWARGQHEIVLICKVGKFPCPKPAPFASSLIHAPVGRHSEKPSALHDRIDSVWPDHAKIEIFSRMERHGWDAMGNEVAS
jgi:N6-adenosine-specific RNA methylase IME4